ncbi:MAG TPA: hypothetical protein VMT18_06605 [Planctomycetota bacterium]|nr:hypothetical protein [Planctomycetota bacterium]
MPAAAPENGASLPGLRPTLAGVQTVGRRSARLPVAYLALWAGAALLTVSVLMAGHWVSLPRPAPENRLLAQGLAGLASQAQPTWSMTHVLYADCRCSQRIFEHLVRRPSPEGTCERVLLVGAADGWERRALERGIELVHLTQEELEFRFGIVSAPLLVISDPSARVRYAGGYTDRKQGLDYVDTRTLAALRAGGPVESLPVYGCGVSPDLQAILDPIGIKYGN